jgi:polysaccharide export outer membrane protein
VVIQGLTPAAAKVIRALGVALWVACTGFLSGCSSFSGDSASLSQEQRASGEGSPATSDRTELARAADKYGAFATPGNSGYKIGPQDVLDITVFKALDLAKTVQVAEAGTINLPLVGEVRAAGKTAAEVERDLEAKLGAKYLKSPQVTVFVKEYNSQRVTVEGAVKKPGVYPIHGRNLLLESIAMAEGLDRETASSSVVVFRTTNGVRSVPRFDIDDIRSGKSEDPQVQQGDIIVVEESTAKTAFQTFTKAAPVFTPLVYLAPLL